VYFSGPFRKQNLTLFLIHGSARWPGNEVIPLDEALALGKIIVHDIKALKSLALENISDDTVFIHAGSTVTVAQSRKTIAVDMLVPANSGIKHLPACPARHTGCEHTLFASYELRRKLETLDSDSVDAHCQALIEAFGHVPDNHGDAIGYASAINGYVHRAELFASSTLFKKLWPDLLKSIAAAGLLEQQSENNIRAIDAMHIMAWFAAADIAPKQSTQLIDRVRTITKSGARNFRHDTVDSNRLDVFHSSYMSY